MARPVVLLLGVPEADRERVSAALAVSGLPAEPVVADSPAQAHAQDDVRVILAGPGSDGWRATADELRRAFPQVALVAVAGDTPCEADGWDDVLTADDLEPRVLSRALRCAEAITRAQERLTRWALKDPLTDVLNRRGLELALVRELAARERGQGPVSALLVDCDDFKRVNDLFGLAAGDAVLKGVAAAIAGAVRAHDTVARVGGDEFLVLLPATRTWEAVEVAERVRTRVREGVKHPDGRPMSVSIGVRRLDDGTTDLEQVIGATQEGLKVSKSGGKDQVRVVDGRPATVVTDHEVSLPPGAKLIEMTAMPVVSLKTGQVHRYLMEFGAGGDAALDLAAQRAVQSAWDLHWVRAALQDAPTDGRPVHVRVYPATVLEVPPNRILGVLPKDLPVDRIVLAIDEQFLSGDPAALRDRLVPLREKGVRVSIDASDLSRACVESLVLLRPETVRLDRGLCQGLSSSRARKSALRRFVQVCDALQVIAIGDGLSLAADRAAALDIGILLASEPPAPV